MFNYAKLNDQGVAIASVQNTHALSGDDLVLLTSYDASVMGKKRVNGLWVSPQRYAIVEAGEVTSIVSAFDAPTNGVLSDTAQISWTYANDIFSPPPEPEPLPDPEPVTPTERNITGVAYLRRFTQAQRIAIRTLAETDPIAKDLMHLLDSTIAQGGAVNLMDTDTILGVGYLASVLPAQNIDPATILA